MLRPATDERAKHRYTREARAAGRIDHPNVVDIYDLGEEGDAGYLVMELLRGESLRALLARGPLSPTAAVDLLVPAMRGVSAAHREGVIHRDLKPDNIFLCRGPEGGEREAKVLDFGISAINAREHDAHTTLTKEGTLLGTPSYMSPEQLASSKDVDALTDVYAFGVILYEALTGLLPFTGDSYSALVLAIANTQPRPPRELCAELPADLEQLVLQAMDKDKDKRPQSMDALVAALAPYASQKGSGEHALRELPRITVPAASEPPRGLQPWVMVAGFAVLVAGSATWWASRPSAPAAPAQAGEATRIMGARPSQPSAAQPSPAQPALLRKQLTSIPTGADVVIDGRKVGVTPYVLELPSDAAQVQVVLRLAGYADVARAVTPTDPEQLALSLQQLPASFDKASAGVKRTHRPRAAPQLAPR
jgi:serine/threonine-protein kinase